MESKKCWACMKILPLDDYYTDKRTKDGRFTQCKKCVCKKRKLNFDTNKKAYKAKIRANMAVRTKREYGISIDEYKKRMKTSDICQLCGKKHKKLHYDHCHKTGKFRGILCPNCNHGLGKLGDDIAGLERAIAYLKGEKYGKYKPKKCRISA